MSFSIGLSGLNAATRRLDAAAFDVARASTQRAGQAPAAADGAAPPPGTAAQADPRPTPAQPAGDAGVASAPASADADLPRAMVESISAANAFLANLQTIRRADETLDALLGRRR